MRRSARFCLEWPRWAIGARSFPESIQVAKFVMSSTRPEQSIEKVSTILRHDPPALDLFGLSSSLDLFDRSSPTARGRAPSAW